MRRFGDALGDVAEDIDCNNGDNYCPKLGGCCLENALSSESGTLVIHSFVIRLWLQENHSPDGKEVWHCQITHIPGGEQQYLSEISEIPGIIADYLKNR